MYTNEQYVVNLLLIQFISCKKSAFGRIQIYRYHRPKVRAYALRPFHASRVSYFLSPYHGCLSSCSLCGLPPENKIIDRYMGRVKRKYDFEHAQNA